MGGSQVMFETPSAFTKKRKRMVGTNANGRVEIKQWNPRSDGESDNYNAVLLYNICATNLYNAAVTGGSWYPFNIYWPAQGTAANQRVGNTIFLKYLRFKGYLRVYRKLPFGCRWRLKLLRFDNFEFPRVTSYTGARDRMKAYLAFYFNNSLPVDEAWGTPNTILNNMRHNFYKTVKKVWDNNIFRSKVIASGYIPPNNDERGQVTTGVIGDMNVTEVGKLKVYADSNGYYNVPLDVKVTCNDVIKVGDVNYYYVLEVDNAVGFYFPIDAAGYQYTQELTDAPLELNFFIRGYFKDQ